MAAPHPIRARRTPPDAIVEWMSFLAGRPVGNRDLPTLTTSLSGELGTLIPIEAGRAVVRLRTMDDWQRAHAWIEARSQIHRAERHAGQSRPVLGILHRLDPVLLWPTADYGVVTKRSLRDWRFVCRLVGAPNPTPTQPTDLAALSARTGIALRTRLAHAPVIRAAITMAGSSPPPMEWVDIPAAPNPTAALARIDRMWLAAELRRLRQLIG